MSNKKKILVISDSLGLPRKSGEELVPYNKTWTNLLKNEFDVHQISMGGATIYQLYEQIKYNELFEPDYVIVQCGIVDCAPRAFKMSERTLFGSVPGVRNVFNKISEKYGKNIRNIRQINYTKPKLFKEYVDKIISHFKNIPVYFIGIVPAVPEYEKQTRGITKQINVFNDILKKSSGPKYIDTVELSNGGLLSDFHHLNIEGNKTLHDKIVKLINI